MQFSFDTNKADVPIEFELLGGPYDGSIVRFAYESLIERPPKRITITADPEQSRGGKKDVYLFEYRERRDAEGVPTGDPEIGYFHQS